MTSQISSYISKCKNDYFISLKNKFGDPSGSIKTYWATLRTLWNGKKVPNIPPLQVSNELITECEVKANICNKDFTSQCSIINNNSVLPSTLNHLIDDKISSFNTSSASFFQLSKNLDPNKAHGHGKIFICSLNMPTTYFILREMSCMWRISKCLEKINIVPVYKKGDKQ